MRRHIGVFIFPLTLLTGACSHEQKPVVTTIASPVQSAPPVAPAARHLDPPESRSAPVAVAPRNRDGSAIFFDFDSSLLRPEAQPVLQGVASAIKDKKREKLRIEGNCDQLGTVEYNMALGEHRALAAKDYLVHLGVRGDRIATISYGSQRPKYLGLDDSDRQKNRRDDFVVTQLGGTGDVSSDNSATGAQGRRGKSARARRSND